MITVNGILIPNRLIQETDVMKLEPEKESEEYWKQYFEQFAIGANDFVNSPQMPIFLQNHMLSNHAKQLENAKMNYGRLGFKIPDFLPAEYEAAANDKLYLVATLPQGWKKIKGETTTGYCYITDNTGSRRVECWIINTTTERSAEYKIVGRYEPFTKIQTHGIDNVRFASIRDNKLKETIYTSHDHVVMPADNERNATSINKLQKLRGDSFQWLHANYPEWLNPFSYWD
jgi:hypothetical protein